MKKIVIFIVLSLFLNAASTQAFEVESFDGSKVMLDDKLGQGKWSLVMFWAHDCHVCKVEFPRFSELHERRKDIDVIGISIDGSDRKQLAQSFLDAQNSSFTSYLSEFTMVAFNYNIVTQEDFRGTPTFLLFTPDGDLIGNMPGILRISAVEDFIDRNS